MIQREHYVSKVRPFYESDLMKIITGIRRYGKSVIFNQIMEENMNQQMTLEEYKKRVIDLLTPKSQNTIKTDVVKSLEIMKNETWEEYMKDFSPEIVAQGFISGLI